MCSSRLAYEGALWRRGRSSCLAVSGKQVVVDRDACVTFSQGVKGSTVCEEPCRIAEDVAVTHCGVFRTPWAARAVDRAMNYRSVADRERYGRA